MTETTTPASTPAPTPSPTREQGAKQPFAGRFLQALWTANSVTVTALAVLFAMAIGAILIIAADEDVRATYGYFFSRPTDALSASWAKVSGAYADLFKGAIINPETVAATIRGERGGGWDRILFPISETLTYAAPLALTGLAFAVAFRGGLFNIGVQGQAIMGAIAAALAGFLLPLPVGMHLIVALLAGLAGGALWGAIPGVLKARTGAHEVITTIMLNYVALFFLSWLVIQNGIQMPGRTDAISKAVTPSAQLPALLSAVHPTLRVHLGIAVAVLVTWGVAWLLRRSTFGFEVRAVGLNPRASRAAGMSVAGTYVLLMLVSGGLAGLGGSVLVLGTALSLTPTVVGSAGFDGLLVGLLGRARPWGVLLAALFFGALEAGGNRMQSSSQISLELVNVLQALVVVFVAAPALVSAFARLRSAGGGLQTGTAKGW